MDSHLTRGFSPLSGLEIKKAVSASTYQELNKHDFLSTNLAYPVAKWHVTVELELASSIHAEPDKITLEVSGGHEQTDDKGDVVETDAPRMETVETTHEVEFPDLTREQFLEGEPP